MKKFTYIAFLTAAAIALCGCQSRDTRPTRARRTDSVYNPLITTVQTAKVPEEEIAPTETGAEESVSAQKETEEAFEETSETGETLETFETSEELDTYYIDEYAAYSLTKAERAFTKDSIFVGDSICRGFAEYKVVRQNNVFARGSLAARSFFDYTMYYGDEEIDFETVLARTQPKYIFFSMGMNDINLTDEATFCENYRVLVELALEKSDAEIFVCAITPVNCDFSSSYYIDCYNLALEQYLAENYPERVHFVDFAKHLKDSEGNLKDCFNGGDGIHLSPYSYYVALWEMHRTMKAEGILG